MYYASSTPRRLHLVLLVVFWVVTVSWHTFSLNLPPSRTAVQFYLRLSPRRPEGKYFFYQKLLPRMKNHPHHARVSMDLLPELIHFWASFLPRRQENPIVLTCSAHRPALLVPVVTWERNEIVLTSESLQSSHFKKGNYISIFGKG